MESVKRLDAVAENVIRPMSQAEAKVALAVLKDVGKSEPSVSAVIKGEGALKDFLVAAFLLAEYIISPVPALILPIQYRRQK